MNDEELVNAGMESLKREIPFKNRELEVLDNKLKNGNINQEEYNGEKNRVINRIIELGRMISADEAIILKLRNDQPIDALDQIVIDNYRRFEILL